MTRTDVHAPKNLVTEDYEYLWCFDNRAPGFLVGVDMAWWRSITNFDPAMEGRGTHRCHHCGAHIRYVALLRHVPSGYAIAVGETCLDNRFERATAEFQKMRKAAQLDRQAQRIKKARETFVLANPDLAFMNLAPEEYREFVDSFGPNNPLARNDFIADVARKLRQYGELSDRQVEAVRRSVAKCMTWITENATRPSEVKAEVPEGRYAITGEVISTKWYDNDFGGSLKMTIKVTTEHGTYRVWGTVPSKMATPERGDVVSIKATVTRSHDDPSFGFFKRPTMN